MNGGCCFAVKWWWMDVDAHSLYVGSDGWMLDGCAVEETGAPLSLSLWIAPPEKHVRNGKPANRQSDDAIMLVCHKFP